MFCNACGFEVESQFNVCPNCGRPIAVAVTTNVPTRLGRHLRTLGILWTVVGALFLVLGVILMGISNIVRVALPASDNVGRTVAPVVLSMIGGFLFVIAASGLVVGWGLLKHQPWGRMVAIVLGIIALLQPPFGTALGIYTLWVLLPDEVGSEYYRLAGAH